MRYYNYTEYNTFKTNRMLELFRNKACGTNCITKLNMNKIYRLGEKAKSF